MQRNISLKYGSIVGILLALFMWLSAFIFNSDDLNKAGFLGFLTMAFSFVFLFVGVKQYRNGYEGDLDFKSAFKMGLSIALIASLFFVVSWMIYFQVYGEQFMTARYEHQLSLLQDEGMNELELGERRLQMEMLADKYKNPLFRISAAFMDVIPMGVIFSFFSALILKK